MGPLMFISGNDPDVMGMAGLVDASMGPLMFISGNITNTTGIVAHNLLQWGR